MSQAGRFSTGGGPVTPSVLTLTGNTGGAVGPDGGGNIDVVGSGSISVAGNPGTNTLTISNSGAVATSFPTDVGTAIPSAGALTIAGGNNIGTVGVGSTVTIHVDGTTNHALQVGSATGALTSLAVATNGQLPIGSTGADPVIANLTAGSGISITNGAGSITIAASAATPLVFHTGSGDATPAANAITMAGGSNISTSGSGSTVTYAVSGTTNHAVQIGNSGGSLTSVAVGATNTVLLGNTGADPSFGQVPNAALANSSITLNNGNNITVTGSPVSLGGAASIAVSGTTNHAIQVGNASGSLTSLSAATNGQIPIGSTGADPVIAAITAGSGISVTNGAGSITIAATGSSFTWTEVTGTSQAMAVNNGYILNNAGLVTATLPATAAVGDIVRVAGKGAGGWLIAQNSGQTIFFGSSTTTTGVGGSLASTNRRDCIELVCVTANNDWDVLSSIGNITVV